MYVAMPHYSNKNMRILFLNLMKFETNPWFPGF